MFLRSKLSRCGLICNINSLKLTGTAFPNTKSKRNVVVFDIDDTLVAGVHSAVGTAGDIERSYRNPECDIVQINYTDYSSWYIFRPYFSILINYLLKNDTRIAFFSAGIEERNHDLMNQILTRLMGEKEYLTAKTNGQFQIFSRHHMRPVIPGEGGVTIYNDGNRVKDLTPVMFPDSETLDDMILIDDNPEYCAHNQSVCIFTPSTLFESKPQHMRISELRHKNDFYYFLGVFKTYFESNKYTDKSLRHSIDDIIKLDSRFEKKLCIPDLAFEIGATLSGLNEVRKTHPEAIFYGSATYVQQYPKIPLTLFHHTLEAIEKILDDILIGKRHVNEPTIYMFLRYLDEDGLQYHITQKGDQAVSNVNAKFMKVAELLAKGASDAAAAASNPKSK